MMNIRNPLVSIRNKLFKRSEVKKMAPKRRGAKRRESEEVE